MRLLLPEMFLLSSKLRPSQYVLRQLPLVFAVAISICLNACAPDSASYQQVRDQQFTKGPALYSTRDTGKWRFLLMPGEYLPNSAANYSHLYSLPELAVAFRTLQSGTQVEWRDDLVRLKTSLDHDVGLHRTAVDERRSEARDDRCGVRRHTFVGQPPDRSPSASRPN